MLLDFINLKNGEGAVYLRLYGQITAAVKSGIIKQGETALYTRGRRSA